MYINVGMLLCDIVIVILLSQVQVSDCRTRHAYSRKPISRPAKPPSEKIFGGWMAYRGEFPFQVTVLEDDSFICGGSILNPWTILTAAHCIDLEDPAPERYSIEAGGTSWWHSEQTRDVKLIFVHEDFDITWVTDDVAILQLEAPLVFNEFVSATILSDTHFDQQALHMKCIASGYGSIGETTHEILKRRGGNDNDLYYKMVCQFGHYEWGYSPGFLLWVKVSLVTNNRCNQKLRRMGYKDISHHNVCSMDPGLGTCSGDSGGPLGCYDNNNVYRQVGITSWGPEKCKTPPNVFVRVSAYQSWIRAHIVQD